MRFSFSSNTEGYSYRLDVDRWNAYEAEVMSDVEGWEVGSTVYNTDRFMPQRVGSRRGHFNY